MTTLEEKAEIARRNGAKSKGPITEAGKERSRRNAIVHGQRAGVCKDVVPPHSALLAHEDRQAFYDLFDRNLSKYRAHDGSERAVVREITDLQWANSRARVLTHVLLDRELAGPTLDAAVATFETLADSKALRNFQRDYAANVRLIGTLERRLTHIQRRWSADSNKIVSCRDERALYERTDEIPPQVIENNENGTQKLTDENPPIAA